MGVDIAKPISKQLRIPLSAQDKFSIVTQMQFQNLSLDEALQEIVRDKNRKEQLWPADVATHMGHLDILELMFDAHEHDDLLKEIGAQLAHRAASGGYVPILRFLAEHNIDLNTPYTSREETPIYQAAVRGDLRCIQFLARVGVDLNKTEFEGWTPLMIAAQFGHEDAVKALVEFNADIHHAVFGGATALLIAAQNGHLGVVTTLYDKGAKLDVYDRDGASPLCRAVQYGHYDVAKFLVNRGSKVDAVVIELALASNDEKVLSILIDFDGDSTDVKKTIIEHGDLSMIRYFFDKNMDFSDLNSYLGDVKKKIIKHGDSSMLKYLVNQNIDFDGFDELVQSQLHLAAKNGDIGMLNFLQELAMSTYVDFNEINASGDAPIHTAIKYGHSEAVRSLAQCGVDCDLKNKAGYKAIDLAVARGFPNILEILFDHGAQVENERHGLDLALMGFQVGNIKILKLLKLQGVDLNQANRNGETLVYMSAKQGNLSMLKGLFELGLDFNVANKDGVSPLMIAVQSGHLNAVRYLMEKKVKVKGFEDQVVPAVYIAAYLGKVDMLKVFSEYGLDLDIQDDQGRTPADIAAQQGARSIGILESRNSKKKKI